MNEEQKQLPAETAYQLENRQFIVRRSFASEKTVAQILTEEITNGILQPASLYSTGHYGTIKP